MNGAGDEHPPDTTETGEGPAVLLLHGVDRTPSMWDELLPLFASRFRVIAPDLTPLAAPPPPGADSLSIRADHVRELLDSLGVERVAIVGHGSGAAVAVLIAEQDPRVDGLVLIDAIGPELDPAREARMAAWVFPVLILWGEDDDVAPVAEAERLNEAIPASTLGLVPESGHFLVEDAGVTIGPIIHEYLRARYAHQPHGHDASEGVVMLQLERRPPWVDLEEDEADPWFDVDDEEDP